MQGKTITRLLTGVLLACSCLACGHRQARQEAARCDSLAFWWRYRNIDSSLAYARAALRLAPGHGAEHAEAHTHLAYVAYQQMEYGKAMRMLEQASRSTADQTVLLCADVMAMKVAQRTGDGYTFFTHRNHALQRIARIGEERDALNGAQRHKFHYALTELHIVSSTYYYYLGQDSAARAEIHAIDPEVSLERDTTQWVYYHYMLGSGGLVTGDEDGVALDEFHHLLEAYTTARATGLTYFQANSLQALASMLASTTRARLIRTREPESYSYLVARFSPAGTSLPAPQLALALARQARALFRQSKDLYQTACAQRTLGEIYLQQGKPRLARSHFLAALAMVEEQKSRDNTTVEPWLAGIHEKLSMAYSALGDKASSDLHRNAYLDLLDQSRQNRELDSRRDLLGHELQAMHARLLLLSLLVLLVAALIAIYTRQLQRSTRTRLLSLGNIRQSQPYRALLQERDTCLRLWQERLEGLQQACEAAKSHARELVQANLERRAKVSLAYAIVPYLDRMRAEVGRMRQQGHASEEQLRYVGELAQEIMRLGELLTEWIQVQRGQLSLHVSTFALADVFHIISLGSHAFSQKGVTLEVQPTQEHVKADKALTMFMVNTLADNARKFTPAGGQVTLRATATGEYVEVSIQDTGEGLSPDDVFTLNHSKVYDPREIGAGGGGKGFGFGLMNCRGIIEKYRKTSAFFQVCAFGVESEQGKGSRFWFRLPRVLGLMLLLTLTPSLGSGAATPSLGLPGAASPSLGPGAASQRQDLPGEATPAQLFDSVYAANVAGRYSRALRLGEQAVARMRPPVDTALLVSLHNEMAISALALRRWDDYRRHNSECVRLHRLYSQDSSLAGYCRQMEKISSDTHVLYVLMSILSLVAMLLFYHLFLRNRLRSRRHFELARECLLAGHESLARYLRTLAAQARMGDALPQATGQESPQTPSQEGPQTPSRSPQATGQESPQEASTGQDIPRQPLTPGEEQEALAALEARLHAALPQDSPLLPPLEGLCHEARAWVEHTREAIARAQEQEEALERSQFEENRLYVMNQILDNSLSTIKHETMYYPARTRQMALAMSAGSGQETQEGLAQLASLLESYRQVYMLLCEQASHQTEQRPPQHRAVPLQPLFVQVAQRMARVRVPGGQAARLHIASTPLVATGDQVLLGTLLTSLATPLAGCCTSVEMQATRRGRFIQVTLCCTGRPPASVPLELLFTPASRCFPYLVARQAVREYDASCGHPGLRLLAEPAGEGFRILCTLLARNP